MTDSRASAWPIIVRELGVEARHSSKYLIRLLSIALFAGAFALLSDDQPVVSESMSIRLFAGIHTLALAGIWFPLIGLCASMAFWNSGAVFFITGVFALALPLLAPELADGFLDRVTSMEWPWCVLFFPFPGGGTERLVKAARVIRITAAILSWLVLERRLAMRNFAVARNPASAQCTAHAWNGMDSHGFLPEERKSGR